MPKQTTRLEADVLAHQNMHVGPSCLDRTCNNKCTIPVVHPSSKADRSPGLPQNRRHRVLLASNAKASKQRAHVTGSRANPTATDHILKPAHQPTNPPRHPPTEPKPTSNCPNVSRACMHCDYCSHVVGLPKDVCGNYGHTAQGPPAPITNAGHHTSARPPEQATMWLSR